MRDRDDREEGAIILREVVRVLNAKGLAIRSSQKVNDRSRITGF
jgi:hypothetical protein